MKPFFKNKQKPLAILITILLSLGLPAATALAGSGDDMPVIVDNFVDTTVSENESFMPEIFVDEHDAGAPVFMGNLEAEFISLQD